MLESLRVCLMCKLSFICLLALMSVGIFTSGCKTTSYDSPCIDGMCKMPVNETGIGVKIVEKGASLKDGITKPPD